MSKVLYGVAALLVVLWILGLIFRYIVGPLVHLLLIAAVVVLAIRFFSSLSSKREV